MIESQLPASCLYRFCAAPIRSVTLLCTLSLIIDCACLPCGLAPACRSPEVLRRPHSSPTHVVSSQHWRYR